MRFGKPAGRPGRLPLAGFSMVLSWFAISGAVQAGTPIASFTYQGQLKSDGVPVNDACDMMFTIWDDALAVDPARQVTSWIEFNVEITDGLFTATVRISPAIFDGGDLWLEVGVSCPGSVFRGGDPIVFTTLSPRQPISAAPHALQTRGIFVDDAERVGLGTTSPGSRLTLSRPTQSAQQQLELRNVGSIQAPNLDGIRFSQGSTGQTTLAAIDVLYRNNGNPDMSFSLRSADDLLFLQGAGRVGIGTTSPDNTLHVHKGSAGAIAGHGNAPLVVENSVSAYLNLLTPAASESGVLFGNPTNNAAGGVIFNNSSAPGGLSFRTGGNQTRMVIDDAGNVGIGLTAPNSRLHVSGLENTGTTAALQVTSGSQHLLMDGNEIDSNGALFVNNNGAGDVILASGGGHVGIGTTGPAFPLHLAGGTDVSPGGGGYFVIGSASGQNIAFDENEIAARNNGVASRLTLNADGGLIILGGSNGGNVGVGTTNPLAKLDVFGAGTTAGGANASEVVARFRQTTGTQHGAISIDAPADQDSVLYFAQNGDARWGLRSDDRLHIDLSEDVEQFQLRYHSDGANLIAWDARKNLASETFRFRFRGVVGPWQDGAYSLGSPSGFGGLDGGRWSEVWSVNGFIQTSDAREKRDVHDLEAGLDEVLRLRPVAFRWKKFDYGREHMGLIAQEAAEVLPDAVIQSEDPNAMLGMNYADLVPVLIKAVQDQQCLIDRQSEQIEALTAAIREHHDTIERLAVRLEGDSAAWDSTGRPPLSAGGVRDAERASAAPR